MYGPGDQFLSGAGLPQDQYGAVRSRNQLNQAKYFLNTGAVSDNIRAIAGCLQLFPYVNLFPTTELILHVDSFSANLFFNFVAINTKN